MLGLNKTKKNESGLASIIVVSLLVVLLTLITVGFAKIMGRSVQNSTSNEAANSATYAAQSGLNDLATYLRQTGTSGVKATKCSDLIGTSVVKGPFYNDANVSGDSNTRYTCLLINQEPSDLVYQNITNLKSQIVKLTTDTVTSSISSYMFSWQARDTSKTSLPPPATNIQDETSWNTSNYVPVLRVTLYPVLTTGLLDDNVQSNSRTFFLVPANAGGAGSKSFDYLSTANGARQKVQCDTASVPGFTGSADYQCNAVVTGLEKITNIDYFYARISPIYNNVDIKIKGNDIDNRLVKYKKVQAVLDVTAKAGAAAKRLQSRVDIAGINSVTGSVSESPNISADDNAAPDFTIRSSNAICKQFKITNDVYDYLTSSCPNPVIVPVVTPAAKLTLSVNGVDSQANSPDPSNLGISYISGGGSAQINWNTTDATSCTASGAGWSGSKTAIMAFTPAGTGAGSQTFNGLTNVTDYTLTCSGPGSGVGPGVAKTGRAWPTPTASISGPASITAGQNYTISWSANNSSRCDLSGDWSSTASYNNASGAPISTQSQTMSVGLQDDSAKTFTVTCVDPSGRSSGAQTITYSRGGPNPILPPVWACTATTNAADTGDASVSYSWDGACPTSNPALGTYDVTSSTDGFISNSSSGSGTTPGNARTTQFCLTLNSNLSPWGTVKTSTSCATPVPPGDPGSPEGPCTATITWSDTGPGTGRFSWDGSCPPVNPSRGYYQLYGCTGIDCNTVGGFGNGTVGSSGYYDVGPGAYCINFRSGADPWGWRANDYKCHIIYAPVKINSFQAEVWDQGPSRCSNTVFPAIYRNSWNCRNNINVVNNSVGCPDGPSGNHRWTTCSVNYSNEGVWWSASLSDGTTSGISCSAAASAPYGIFKSGGATDASGPWGWSDFGPPYPFILNCTGPGGSTDHLYWGPGNWR